MKLYMLDTNTVSYLIKGNESIARRIVDIPLASLCISAMTEGELFFGLAKRPHAKKLHVIVREFLRRVDVLPWDTDVAKCYGTLRAKMTNQGKTLAPLDLLIAAHALSLNAVLITHDKVFSTVPNLMVEDWSLEPS